MRQSLFLCTAAVTTVMVALVILGFFALVVINVEQLTRNWSREVQVTAYLSHPLPPAIVKQKQTQLAGFPEVEEVNYISPEMGYQRFAKRLADDAVLLKGMPEDFLPGAFEITLQENQRNRAGVDAVVKRLQHDRQFGDLRYGADWLERFEAFVALIRLAGAILGGFLLFAALFIVSNTIKLTLFARRDELEVMALVGGTPVFIKMPFLLEGAIQGALGGLLALLLSYGFFHFVLQEQLSQLLMATGVSRIIFLPFIWQAGLVLTGVLLGLIGSFLSLQKLVRI